MSEHDSDCVKGEFLGVEPSKHGETDDTSLAPSHFVAIGASAGGLEALQQFVRNMPDNSDMAFMLVQHLSPDFKSLMDELLSQHTKMRVMNATEGLQVQRNTIYLIPPRKNMMIAEGCLLLVDQMPHRGNNFPIDIFFRSLAEDQLHRSIAIVLSGTGSDGSRGIQSIKEVGGLVVVQAPEDAKFNGMPYRAVKTGLADIVAPGAEIPKKLIQYISHPMVNGSLSKLSEQVEGAEAAFKEIYELLKNRSDIDFSQYKTSTVSRRIERRIGINGLSNISQYHSLLLRNPNELQALAKNMLIGVTRFFRDTDAYETLEKLIIPQIFENSPADEPIRVWVAGCSSGEEAYSMAILFDEAMQARGVARSIKIFATDVDSDATTEASNGQFDLNISADMSEQRLKRYFIQSEECYTIVSSVRHMVVFATHNLLKDPPFSNCQLSVCRNVLIYFQPPAQKKILSMLHFSLQASGYLFLGASESLGDIAPYFEVVDERNRIYSKISTSRILPDTIPPANPVSHTLRASQTPSVEHLVRNYQQHQKPSSYVTAMETLINDYVPACILLNLDLEVMHVYGNIGPFTRKLQAGRFSAKINDFIAEDLSIAVSTSLHRAAKEQQNVKYGDVQFKHSENGNMRITIRAVYIPAANTATPYIALVFECPSQSPDQDVDNVIKFDASSESHTRIHDLEQALQRSREDLQVTVEELETTNEELQSSNEELMASNEELQSTNEELQSVNEELYSVNSEYQQKIDEISQVNLDLDNIIKSAEIGFIFLDDAMLIRRFSPLAAKTVNLIEADLGRPFHHISHSLKYEAFLNDISFVVDSEAVIEKEIESHKGMKIWLKIAPYYHCCPVNFHISFI